jgi:phosphate transport system substrate-binding protein
VYPLVEASREWLMRDFNLDVVAQTGGSTRGFEDCIAGRNDLGAMAREPTPEEARQIEIFPVAYDGVGIVVNTANPLESIATEQLRRIYRKQERDWRAFATWDGPITVVNRAEGHATLEAFLEHTGLRRDEIEPDAVGGDNAQILRLVANSSSAIGYVSIGEAMHAREIGMPVRLLTLDGVKPTLAHVADKSYPMVRQLYLVAKGAPSARGRVLIDFFRTEPGQRIVREAKYVPIP